MLTKYFLKILRKYLDILNFSKYILSMKKINLSTAKNHTTISIPKTSVKFIEPLRSKYSEKFGLPLTKGETVGKALEEEFGRNVGC